jgi:hypothetical protein
MLRTFAWALAAAALGLIACSDDDATTGGGSPGDGGGASTTSASTSSGEGGTGGTNEGGDAGTGGDTASGGAGGQGGGEVFPPLPACGGFTDDFESFDLDDVVWDGFSAAAAGQPGDICVEVDPDNIDMYGGIYTEDYYPLEECFVSVRIDDPSDANMFFLSTSIDQISMQVSGQVFLFVTADGAEAWVEDGAVPAVMVGSFTGSAVTAVRMRFSDRIYFDLETNGNWMSIADVEHFDWADLGKLEVGASDGTGPDAAACYDDFNLDAP